MALTKEFLKQEVLSLESEIRKAQTFLTQAQAVLDSYRMLIVKFDEPEDNNNGGNLS